jgi:hypothetical protein
VTTLHIIAHKMDAEVHGYGHQKLLLTFFFLSTEGHTYKMDSVREKLAHRVDTRLGYTQACMMFHPMIKEISWISHKNTTPNYKNNFFKVIVNLLFLSLKKSKPESYSF